MTRKRAAALLSALAMTLAGCAQKGPALPPDPPSGILERSPRQPWGDAVGARVGGLAGHVHDQLHDRYGAVRETGFIGRDPALIAGLEQWYAERLAKGWKPAPVDLPAGEHAFAFATESRAIALAWLDPLPDGRIPVVLMRYGE